MSCNEEADRINARETASNLPPSVMSWSIRAHAPNIQEEPASIPRASQWGLCSC
jgi:hypothetical protein